MGVWVIGFRDIGYRACRRLFPWSSSGYGTLGFLLVRSSCFFPAFLFRAMSFEALSLSRYTVSWLVDMPTVLSVLFSARDLDSPFLWVRVGLAGGIGKCGWWFGEIRGMLGLWMEVGVV